MTTILHLITLDDVLALGPGDPIVSTSLDTDGFIHCTDAHDVLLAVANAFYTGLRGTVVALHIDVESLTSRCVREVPADIAEVDRPLATHFPHVYGPIDREAVIAMQVMARDDDGGYTGYGDVEPAPSA